MDFSSDSPEPQPGVPVLDLHGFPKQLTPETLLCFFFAAFERVATKDTLLPLNVHCQKKGMRVVRELRNMNAIQLKYLMKQLALADVYHVLCNYLACQGEMHHRPAVTKRSFNHTFFSSTTPLAGPGGVFENFNVFTAYGALPYWLCFSIEDNGDGEHADLDGRRRISFVAKTFAVAMLKHMLVDYGVVTINDKDSQMTFIIRRLANLFCLAYTWEVVEKGHRVLVGPLAGEKLLHNVTITLLRNWRRFAMKVRP